MEIGGRYLLGEELLRVGPGSLHSALDQATGEPVVVRTQSLQTLSAEARLQCRAMLARVAGLNHSCLPRGLELVDSDDTLYAVLENFSGVLLESGQVPLPSELISRYLQQLLTALDYLHTLTPPVVHRDVSPGTILIGRHGRLKLLATGMARSAAGSLMGTAFRGQGSPEYAAPEQLLGEPSHPRNDLYSAGAVAWYLATGQPPTPSLERVRQVPPQPLSPPPGLAPELATVILSLLAVEPEDRPESAGVVLARLTAQAADEPGSTPDAPPDASAGALASHPPALAATSKRSMWQLLFGGRAGESATRTGAPQPEAVPSVTPVAAPEQATPSLDLTELELDLEIVRKLPETVARAIGGICVGFSPHQEMVLAVKDPGLVYIYDHIEYATHGRYRPVLRQADPVQLDRALEWAYRSHTQIRWRTWLERRALDSVTLVVANPMADSAIFGEDIPHPVIEATERVIKEALAVNTSDIHLEMFDNRLEVRYRIDGVLQTAGHYPVEQGSAMIKRIKVMANMDIAQERIPQGGRISLSVGEQRFDLRVSIVPVPSGESVVMRVLPKGAFTLTLADLGLDPPIEARFRHALTQPHGMILVCGPTGSGKSTTLYASLKELQRPDRKLLTVEDPIEYEMDGLVQVQVNMAPKDPEMRVTFAWVLREFLRQDPEVILVGEVRDPETAAIAIQASLTGHLVLSTLHTNDSVGIIGRLRDMGSQPYLIASTLRAGLAQRLARRICPDCRRDEPISAHLAREFEREEISGPYRVSVGQGCRACRETGYRGRIGLYEVLEVTESLRELISAEARTDRLLQELKANGFRTLYQNGLEKVAQGQITYEEVRRVCET